MVKENRAAKSSIATNLRHTSYRRFTFVVITIPHPSSIPDTVPPRSPDGSVPAFSRRAFGYATRIVPKKPGTLRFRTEGLPEWENPDRRNEPVAGGFCR